MAAINGVIIPGTLVPTDTTDTYAVTDPQYGIDGCRSVTDKATRNAIPPGRRRQGMLVVIQQDFGLGPNTVWQLKAPPWNNNDADWVQLILSTTASTVGGDLSGTLPNPSVISTNGIPFGTIATQNASAVNITGGIITGLSTPVSASDAVNKSYVDATTTGLSPKNACRVAATTNLTATYSNGASGVGATLTNSGALSALTLDGVAVSVSDRVLVKNQTSAFQNGIYSVTNIGSASVAWILTRTTDYNSSVLVAAGTYTVVSAGTVNGGTLWMETGVGPFTIGTTSITFTQLNIPPLTLTFTGDVSGTGLGTVATTVLNINGTPLGSTTAVAGNLLVASGTQWVSVHLSGDATISAAGLIIVTKTNGVSFAPSATTDTTNAINITSGVVSTARLGAGPANTTTFLRGDGVWATPSSAATSISIGSGITGGTPNSVLYIDSSALLAQDNTHLSYNPSTQVLTATHFSGDGFGVTNINASNLASGTVPTARLGSGTASSATFLAGNNTWQPIIAAASAVTYSNTVSGLPAADVQSAIDTLSSLIANRNISNGTTLISGGGVAWVSGYTFRVSAATYYIANVFHSSFEQTITLTTPDPTNNRVDAIVLDSTGTVSAIAGVPAPVPVPPVIDPRTYIELTHVTVVAGSTQPSFFTKVLVYDENAGTPVEWAATSSGSGWALASTNNPYTGTKDIEATAVAANSYIQLAPTSAIDPTIFTQLAFHIRSKATWPGPKSLSIAWYNGGVRQGSAVALGTGTYGFDSTITGAYQQIVLPIGLFALAAGTMCTSLRMTVLGGGAGIGFYLDDVEIQTNSGALPSGYPSIIGPLTLLGNPSATGPAIPSALTIGAGFTVTGTTISVSGGGGGGTPGGSTLQLQFNNAGVFDGVTNSFVDTVHHSLAIGRDATHSVTSSASGTYSFAFGGGAVATAPFAFAEGQITTAGGTASHAEGYGSYANVNYSHAEGQGGIANGIGSHAEGSGSTAGGDGSHSEGGFSNAAGQYSHAEGSATTAAGVGSHSEGIATHATADHSHAEGDSTQAIGISSHTEGYYTIASGDFSNAGGLNSLADLKAKWARGDGSYASSPVTLGNSQVAVVVCSGIETTPTPVVLTIGGCAGNTDKVLIRNGVVCGFVAHIVGRIADGSNAVFFIRQGLIKNIGGTTSLVGTIQTIGTDINPISAIVVITADDTNDALSISCDPAAVGDGTIIHWTCRLDLVEVG